MNLIVRQADPKDFESLCEIYAELDELHRKAHPELFIEPEGPSRSSSYLSKVLADRSRTIFIAELDSKVIGFAECVLMESSDFPVLRKRQWLQLDNIAVKHEFQHLNIGTKLFEQVVSRARTKGLERIELKVYSFNQNAREFYTSKGFQDLYQAMYLDLS